MSYKDRSTTSDANYHKLRQLVPALPTKYSIVNYRKTLGHEIRISKNEMGFYYNCREKISIEVKRRISHLQITNNIKIRIAGDGTLVQVKKETLKTLTLLLIF